MLGVFWKIQGICYVMGTEILKIEEDKFALLWGEAQKKIAYSYPRVTYSYHKVT